MRFSKISFGTLALATIATNPLLAADLPARTYKAPPMMAPAAATWSGCYVGIEGGGAWGSSRHSAAMAPFLAGQPITNSFGLSGGLIGGTVGCNYQIDSWVFGVENDISWTSFRGTGTSLAPFTPQVSSRTDEKWLDTLRGRVGFSWDRALIYGTAGVAFAGVAAGACSNVTGACLTNTQTRTGWVVGAGVEYAVWENLSLKLEYLHADFGNGRYFNTPGLLGPVTIITRDVKLTNDLVRVGVNWRFNSLPGMLSPGL